MSTIQDMYAIVNTAIDCAFYQEKYNLNFHSYLSSEKFKQADITIFIHSGLGIAIQDQVKELEIYLNGGAEAAFFREAYSWMGKPRARKVKDYLNCIMDDAKKYEQSKRRGRKPGTKNKQSSVPNK